MLVRVSAWLRDGRAGCGRAAFRAGLPGGLDRWGCPGEGGLDAKALVFRHSLVREAASAIGGRVARRAFVSGFPPVRLQDVAELPLPAWDWVRVETTVSGAARLRHP